MKKSNYRSCSHYRRRVRLSIKKRKHLEEIFGKDVKNLNDEDLVLFASKKRKKRRLSFLSKTHIEKRKV